MVARVLIDSSVKDMNRVYDYKVPEELEKQAKIGKRVLINFGNGKGREEEGIIVAIADESKFARLKNITQIIDEYPVVTKEELSIAKWISKEYFCNAYDAIKLFFPPGTTAKFKSKKVIGDVTTEVYLTKGEDEILEDIERNVFSSGRHIRILKFLIESGGTSYMQDVMENMDVTRAVIDAVRKKGYIEFRKVEVKETHEDFDSISRTEKLILNDKQQKVKDELEKLINKEEYSCNLLKGITGSGKTEVYMQIMEGVINKGKNCIVLVPEIALTHQMLERFVGRFGKEIAVLHSKMTYKERKKEWLRIRNNEVKVVIGARSALFSGLKNVGIIIIDEAHDLSYKSQNTPRYDAIEVARKICMEENIMLLLGSATPDIGIYRQALDGKINLFRLDQRAGNAKLPKIEVVDMKIEQILVERRSKIFSERFLDLLEDRISKGEQTMVFLNRRGHSTYIRCKACSNIMKCPNCDVALTYHKKTDLCICHYCSYAVKLSTTCPICNEDELELKGLGIEKVEEELKRVFNNNISTIRMDADTTMIKDGHKKILEDFKNNNINVLIGTQMISKGHDIPNVTLVCIVDADAMLNVNECQAGERAFSNMLQVSGRAGRKDKEGTVVIQTYTPESNIIKAVVDQSYDELYDNEIIYRKILNFPPFTDIIQLDIYADELSTLKDASERLQMYLEKIAEGKFKVNKAARPFIQKIKNKYRMYIIIKCSLEDDVSKRIKFAISKFEENEKQLKVKISVTRNPIFVG